MTRERDYEWENEREVLVKAKANSKTTINSNSGCWTTCRGTHSRRSHQYEWEQCNSTDCQRRCAQKFKIIVVHELSVLIIDDEKVDCVSDAPPISVVLVSANKPEGSVVEACCWFNIVVCRIENVVREAVVVRIPFRAPVTRGEQTFSNCVVSEENLGINLVVVFSAYHEVTPRCWVETDPVKVCRWYIGLPQYTKGQSVESPGLD